MTNSEEIEKLNAYFDSLMEQKRILDDLAQKEAGIIRRNHFAGIAKELGNIGNEFPGLLPEFIEAELRYFYPVKSRMTEPPVYDLTALRSYLAGAVSKLRARLSRLSEINIPMKVTREGVFFSGQYFDALNRVTEILSQAQQEITIIDGYINNEVLTLLTPKKSGVSVKILTSKVDNVLQIAASAFNKQYGNLAIRTSRAFHDRFVIVDNSDFYHFGASIKDVGNRGFMFSLIEEPTVIDALRTKFNQEWGIATSVV